MILRDRAQGRWRDLLATLGIDSRHLTGKHGPCPICRDGSDRFRFDNKDGRGTWICSFCGAGDGFALLMKAKGLDFAEAANEVEKIVGSAKHETEKRRDRDEKYLRDAMNHLWLSSSPVTFDDPVSRYLAARGITAHVWPKSLRTAKKCSYRDGDQKSDHPAMIAMVTGADGKPVTLHRTYLNAHGGKADVENPRRLMPGKIGKGCAVRLGEAGRVLGIAEGIETALSATVIFGVPCWAAINASMLMAWEPPSGVRELIVFGDNDPKFAGQSAAYSLAYRIAHSHRGVGVEVRIPGEIGTDWNDALRNYSPLDEAA